MTRATLAGLVCCLTLFGCAAGQSPVDPWPAECDMGASTGNALSDQAQQLLEQALEADHGTGITAAVVTGGTVVWQGAAGNASGDLPLSANARMRLGSVSKVVTATMAASLAADGKLDLEQPVNELITRLPHAGVTPYHLATHTSGIRHYNFNAWSEANNRIQYDRLADSLPVFADDPLVSPPGTEFHYSSLAYNLLGMVMEETTGTPYPVLVSTMAGAHSIQVDDEAVPVKCRPAFSTILFGRFRIPTVWRDNSDYYPSGGLLGSAPDIALFTYNALSAGSRLRARLTAPVMLPDGSQTSYTFGWQVGLAEDGTVEWYGHGGQTNGAYASVRYYPRFDTVVAAMTNYNYWLTSRRPAFFAMVREELPLLFFHPNAKGEGPAENESSGDSMRRDLR